MSFISAPFKFALFISLSCFASYAFGVSLPEVRDIYGTTHSLDEYSSDQTKAIVIAVLDPQCPVAQKSIPALIDLYYKYNSFEKDRAGRPANGKSYAGDQVLFLGVYTKKDIGAKAMAAHAAEMRIPFQVVYDPTLDVMRHFKLSRLSETILLDAQWQTIYQGPINNQNIQGVTKKKSTRDYLTDALTNFLNDKPIELSKVPAVGCVVDTSEKSEKVYHDLTYSKDIAPIVKKRCQKCHEEGAVGPMPLQSYQDVSDWSGMIEEVILDERMPPWPSNSKREFAHTEQLTADERLTFLRWLRSDMNMGEELGTAPRIEQKKASEWNIEDADFVFEMPKAVEVPATGVIEYVYVPIPINGGEGFPEDRWIEAIETKPGAPEVVHHIQVHEYHGPMDKAPTPLEQILMYGLSIENARLIGSYTPGNAEENFRDYRRYLSGHPNAKSVGMKLSKGANLIMEMHYTTNGRATLDKSAVAIRFSKKKPDLDLQTWFPFRKRADMIIPANVKNHSLQDFYHFGSKTNGKAVLVHGIRPHLHARGKNYRLELIDATSYDPKEMSDFDTHNKVRGEEVLSLPVWDFNWQHLYRFKEPILVKPNQAFLATAYWDNSEQNPRNPDFQADVPWGQQTEQEMFNTLFIYEILEPNDPRLQNK